jgi:hypothetical protein
MIRTVIRRAFDQAWAASAPLTALTGLMLVVLVVNLAGLALDPRTIGGEPAWLKPTKFAFSTALYAFSVAFVFQYLPEWPRLRTWTGGVIAVSLMLEIVLIDLQAFRGIASHFNVRTIGDATIFSVMGLSVACLWVASLGVAIVLVRQRFDDAAFGWLLRFGLAITVIGAALGGLMTRPTPAQMRELRAAHRIEVAGAHTVGALDGGPGYPLMHWSRQDGDLRVPHFVGLHALQVLPLLYLAIGRLSRSPKARSRIAVVSSLSYAALVAILLWEAMHGEPVFSPASTTLRLLGVWFGVTVAALVIARQTASDVNGRGLAEARG